MECPVCTEPFDKQACRPKCLPCGHTLCLGCLQRLPDRRCPQCRQGFAQAADDLPDNFFLLHLMEAVQPADRPAAAQWCMDCRAPSSARCHEHDVRNPKVVLRQCLQDVVPRARQQLDGLQDGLQDGGALTALRLLRGAPSTCRISLRQDDGEAFGAEVRVEEDSLLQALVLSLAASGRLLQEHPAAAEPQAVVAAPPVAAAPPAPERIPELDLKALTEAAPGQRVEDKASTLQRVRQRGVRRMTYVWCNRDPAWALDVLRCAAPTLEELEVVDPCEEHLLAVHAMPGLRRLELQCGDDALDARPPVLPALPRGSLQWLRVWALPRPTLQSLLRAHSATLDELWLCVGTPGGGEWPVECDDLDALLGQCGLRVSRLALWRDSSCSHSRPDCPAQLAAVRRVLPAANVQCNVCDGVADEDF